MTATNHFLAGALIGAAVSNPVVGFAAAVFSHYLLDALPHFGFDHEGTLNRSKSRLFRAVTGIDAILATTLVVVLAITQPLLLIFCLAAFLPDLEWVYRFGFQERMGTRRGTALGRTGRFHISVQKLESPKGIVFEVFFAAGLVYSLAAILA